MTSYFFPGSSQTKSDQNRIKKMVGNEKRFQGIHFHEQNNSLDLVYLWSYEPISRRFAAIYISPGAQVVSDRFSDLRSIQSLYRDLSTEQLHEEMAQVFEIPITFWSVSRNDQLSQIVDGLGGIKLPTPEQSIRMNLRKKSEAEGQWMDGKMTLDYVSSSYSDFGIQGLRYRHKTFFLGILTWLRTHPSLRNHKRTVEIFDQFLETNLVPKELKSLSEELLQSSADKIKFPAIGRLETGEQQTGVRIQGEKIKRMLPRPLKEIINEAEPQEIIRVQVLNGAGIAGLAGDVRDFLQSYSRVDVVEVGNAQRYDHQTTKVIDRSNNPESAYRVLEILNNGEYESDPSKDLMVDVTVIAGRDLRSSVSNRNP